MHRRILAAAVLAASALGTFAFAPASQEAEDMPYICVRMREEAAPGVDNPFGTRPICVTDKPVTDKIDELKP